VAQGSNEDQRHGRLYDDLRKKLLDLSRRNPMLNYKHRAGSRRQLRIVNANLESAFAELAVKQTELSFAALPEPDDIPEDELSETFKTALGHAKSTDLDYLTRSPHSTQSLVRTTLRWRTWNVGCGMGFGNNSNCRRVLIERSLT